MNYEEQVAKGWVIIAITSVAFALAVIFYMGYSSSAYAREPIVELPVQVETTEVVPCDTDLDCMLKNPNIEPY